jgi:phage repressor protein C with HTH and peptisase S24 domain
MKLVANKKKEEVQTAAVEEVKKPAVKKEKKAKVEDNKAKVEKKESKPTKKKSEKPAEDPVAETLVSDVPVNNTEVSEPVVTEDIPVSEEEVKAKDNKANVEAMEKSLALVSNKFNIGEDYVVTRFDFRGTRAAMTLSNKDFDVTIKIKDTVEQGITILKD